MISTFEEAKARLAPGTDPLTGGEIRELIELRRHLGTAENGYLAGLEQDRERGQQMANAQAVTAEINARMANERARGEERDRLWREAPHATRALMLLGAELGQTSDGSMVRKIANALARPPEEIAASEAPIHFRFDLLPDHVRRRGV